MIDDVKIEVELVIAVLAAWFTYTFGSQVELNFVLDTVIALGLYVGYYVGARVFWHYSRERTYKNLDKFKSWIKSKFK